MNSIQTRQNRDLSRQLLLGVAETLEKSDQVHGQFNHLVAQYAGNACRLLRFPEAEERFKKLLAGLTAERYWAGVLTNLDTTKLPSGAKELSPIAEIARKHPVFPDDYAQTLLIDMGEHFSACASRDYERAFSLATTELEKEEVILAQVLMGDFDLAADSLLLLSEPHRRHGVLFVMSIELYRHDQRNKAEDAHRLLPDEMLREWGAAHMAVGIANHVPWQIYPFPDY